MAKTTAGDLDAMMEFLGLLARDGAMARATVDSWRSATKSVVEEAQGAGAGQFDARSIDVDEWLKLFEEQSVGKRAPQSLAVYRGRFHRAIDAYRNYLDDPSWRPDRREPQRRDAGGATVVTYEPAPGFTAEIALPPRISATELSALLASLVREA